MLSKVELIICYITLIIVSGILGAFSPTVGVMFLIIVGGLMYIFFGRNLRESKPKKQAPKSQGQSQSQYDELMGLVAAAKEKAQALEAAVESQQNKGQALNKTVINEKAKEEGKAAEDDGQADFSSAMEYYEDDCIEEAREYFEKAASKGHIEAEYYLGMLYVNGEGVEQDYSEARKHFLIAAEGGDASAQCNVGSIYCQMDENYSEGLKWFRRAAEGGDIEAMNNIGQIYYHGAAGEKDYEEAEKWLKKASEGGHEGAAELLPKLYDRDGKLINMKLNLAKVKEGADVDGKSAYELGKMYIEGSGVKADFDEGFKWLVKAGDLGYVQAQEEIASMYWQGFASLKQDYKKALEWFERAAALGSAKAELNIGVAYADGLGVERSREKAVEWYLKSAQKGKVQAQYNLAMAYLEGSGIEQSYEKAAEWFLKAAENGDEDAQYEIGKCYKEGIGVEKDIDKAGKWLNEARKKGVKKAEGLLREIYASSSSGSSEKVIPRGYKTHSSGAGYSIDFPDDWVLTRVFDESEMDIIAIPSKGAQLPYEMSEIYVTVSCRKMPSFLPFNFDSALENAGIADESIELINGYEYEGRKVTSEAQDGTIKTICFLRGGQGLYTITFSVDKNRYDAYTEVIEHMIDTITIDETTDENDEEIMKGLMKKMMGGFSFNTGSDDEDDYDYDSDNDDY